jgi:hypothetical protein
MKPTLAEQIKRQEQRIKLAETWDAAQIHADKIFEQDRAILASLRELKAIREAKGMPAPVAYTTQMALDCSKHSVGFEVSSVNLWGDKGIKLYGPELRDHALHLQAKLDAIHEAKGMPEPVALGMRSVNDGSWHSEIAVCGWATFDRERRKLEDHKWVVNGVATIEQLYGPELRDHALHLAAENAGLWANNKRLDGLWADLTVEFLALQGENARLRTFYDAIDHQMIVLHLGTADTYDAKTALEKIIEWNIQIALDPQVSADAQRLRAELEGGK